jgi:predicted RND superfamily exporter protein
MIPFSGVVVRFRLLIIITITAITVFFTFGMTRLEINSDITSYLKPSDPVMILFNRIGDEYGGNHMVFIGLRAQNIITTESLDLLKKLSDAYKNIDGVSSVTSLVNIIDIKETALGLEVGKLIDPNNIPVDPGDLASLRKYILSKDIYRGKIVSEDGTTTIIICRLKPEVDKATATQKIIDATEQLRGHYQVFYSGFPVETLEMGKYILDDLKILIPITILIIIAVLFFSFRTIRGIVLPLLIVVIATIWTMGLMGYTGTPLSMISNVIPVLLLGLGTAYGIHFLARYYEDISTNRSRREDIQKSIIHIGIPIVLTAITTVAGFLSFTGAYITAITQFGIFSAFGVFIAMVLSLTFLPALLTYLKVKGGGVTSGEKHILRGITTAVARFVPKRYKLVLTISLGTALLAALIIPRIHVESDLIGYFPEKSEIRKADAIIKKDFGGSTSIQLIIDGDIKNPVTLQKMYTFEKFLGQLHFVSNTQSLADLIARMNKIMTGHKTIPETKEEVANLLFLLEGEEIMNQLVNTNYSEAVVQATFGTDNGRIRKKTLIAITQYINAYINQQFSSLSVADTDPSSAETARSWSADVAARAICYDVHKLHPESSPDVSTLRNWILTKTEEVPEGKETDLLTDPDMTALKKELQTFFEEESEIYIDNAGDIEKTVEHLILYAEQHTADKNAINNLLKTIIPRRYWAEYPESVPHTGEFVYAKIKKAQNESRTRALTDDLMRSYFGLYTDDEKVRSSIEDDLWILNRSSAAVPVSFSAGPSMENNPAKAFSLHSKLTGMFMISERLNNNLVKSQVQSLIIAIVVVWLLLALQFKSMKTGLVVLSPIILVILVNFAIMGYTGIPLDYATMLVGSVLIGVGIDYSIHFSSRFKSEFRERHDAESSLQKTLDSTGIAIIINALMVACGFFVLVAGQFVPIKRAGWMIGLLMILSAFAALVYLPSFILLLRGSIRFDRHPRNNKKTTS